MKKLTITEFARMGGIATRGLSTPKKAAAARRNGKRSAGRPRLPDSEVTPAALRRRIARARAKNASQTTKKGK